MSEESPEAIGAQDTPPVSRGLVVVVALATVAGAVLRFVPRSGLWLDEALSVNIAGLPLEEIPGALRRDGHPPLYYFVLHLWSSLGEGDWWVRALSGIFGLVGFPLAWAAGRRLGRRRGAEGLGARRLGLLALMLWAVLPYGVRYGSETRMYSMVATLVLAGYLLVDNLLAEPRRRDLPAAPALSSAAGLAVIGAALLWSHYWSLWLLAATGVVALGVALRAIDPARRRRGWLCVAALAVSAVAFGPWVPSMLYQSSHTGTPWGEVFRPATILVVTLTDFVGGGFGELQLVSYALVVALAVAVFGQIRRRAGRPVVELGAVPQPRVLVELGVVVLTMAIGWAASVVASTTYASRYAAVVFPLFALALAGGLAMARSARSTTVVAALVAAALVLGCVLEVTDDRTQADTVADAVVEELAARPGGTEGPITVVACPDQLGPATERALSQRGIDAEVVPYPTAGDPRFVDWVDYAERNKASDPAAFAAEVLDGAGDEPVFAVINTGYTTFEGRCDALLSLLGAQSGPMTQVVAGDADNYFEAMDLWVRPPAS